VKSVAPSTFSLHKIYCERENPLPSFEAFARNLMLLGASRKTSR